MTSLPPKLNIAAERCSGGIGRMDMRICSILVSVEVQAWSAVLRLALMDEGLIPCMIARYTTRINERKSRSAIRYYSQKSAHSRWWSSLTLVMLRACHASRMLDSYGVSLKTPANICKASSWSLAVNGKEYASADGRPCFLQSTRLV